MKWPWDKPRYSLVAGDYHSEVVVIGDRPECTHSWVEKLPWERVTAERSGAYRCIDCGETVRWWQDWSTVTEE
jgi:hypothetical protein